MGNCSGLGKGMVEESSRFHEKLLFVPGGEHFEIHFYADQVLTQTVVKFAGELAALGILDLQEAAGETAERVHQLQGGVRP